MHNFLCMFEKAGVGHHINPQQTRSKYRRMALLQNRAYIRFRLRVVKDCKEKKYPL